MITTRKTILEIFNIFVNQKLEKEFVWIIYPAIEEDDCTTQRALNAWSLVANMSSREHQNTNVLYA
jgi:hypothetical protein